jgi:uncharacterized protein (TIGR02147 family)
MYSIERLRSAKGARKSAADFCPTFGARTVATCANLDYAAGVKIALTADPRATASEQDIPSLLRERLRAAKRRNPRFSLRSFAKQLAIDHSTLSQVLRNRRRLSARALEGVGKRMGLSDEAIRAYAQSHQKKKPTSPPQDLRGVHFDLDTFQTLSIWHHYAILELIQVEGFKTDSRWIAKTLGIAVEDVNIALQRLMRLGLLEMAGRDRWVDTSGDAEFRSATLTEAARNRINQEIHEQAIEAIQGVPSEQRVHRQVVVALDSKRLSKLQALADEFVSELRRLATESDAKDDVYQVEISLFPVTTRKKTRGEKNG